MSGSHAEVEPPPAYHTVVQDGRRPDTPHLTTAPPHNPHTTATGLDNTTPSCYPKEYRVEYRSGPPHIDYGITLEERRVKSVETGSTAAQSGVEPGGEVLEVNGVDHRGHTHAVIAEHLGNEYARYSTLTVLLDYSSQNYSLPTCDCTDRCVNVSEALADPLKPAYRTQGYTFPYSSEIYGFGFSDAEVTQVMPGSMAFQVGLRTGAMILEVNGVPVSQLGQPLQEHFAALRRNHQDLHILVGYPKPTHSGSSRDTQGGPHEMQGANSFPLCDISQTASSTNQSSHDAPRAGLGGYSRPRYWRGRDFSVSWGENMLLDKTEARILDLWSAMNFICFCPLGCAAICFTVNAENAESQEAMRTHRKGAYITNILATILGIVTLIVLLVVFLS